MRPERDRLVIEHLASWDDLALNTSQIARLAGIPRSTVRDWLQRPARSERRVAADPDSLPEAEYSYLLGIYLGDGCISTSPRVSTGCGS